MLGQEPGTELALRESQARFKRLTSGLKESLFVFTTTMAGEILYLSDGYRLLGRDDPEQRFGEHWRDLADWTEESVNTLLDKFTRLLTGERDRADFELSYAHPDGSLHHLALHCYRIHSQDTDQDFIEGIAFDITRSRTAEARLRNLERAIDQAPVSILITDAEARIEYVNPFFCEITGYSEQEVLGATPRMFKSGEQQDDLYHELWSTIQRGHIWRGELVNKRKDGSLYWESATITPIRDARGRTVNYLGVKENIDDRKELERIKEDVEHIMRHDLKNPLNAILALPELLLLDDNLTADQRDSLTLIQESARKMRDMIELSLDLFKMETGQFDYRPQTLNLVPLLRQVTRVLSARAQARQVSFRYHLDGESLAGDPSPDQPVHISGDARLLFSMLSNLIANAIDASPPGEAVVLSLEHGDPLRLSIINQGVVPAAIRAHFFEKYRTLGKKGGTGLGTYSAKLMATTMGFDIQMETSDAHDSTSILLLMPAGHLL
jgi:PAS domain S-box-containing protein